MDVDAESMIASCGCCVITVGSGVGSVTCWVGADEIGPYPSIVTVTVMVLPTSVDWIVYVDCVPNEVSLLSFHSYVAVGTGPDEAVMFAESVEPTIVSPTILTVYVGGASPSPPPETRDPPPSTPACAAALFLPQAAPCSS